jgi:hypothetical protein
VPRGLLRKPAKATPENGEVLMPLWLNNGALVIKDGALVLCGECPCEESCTSCLHGEAPASLVVEISGWGQAGDECANCAGRNGAFVLDWAPSGGICLWAIEFVDPCAACEGSATKYIVCVMQPSGAGYSLVVGYANDLTGDYLEWPAFYLYSETPFDCQHFAGLEVPYGYEYDPCCAWTDVTCLVSAG